jgi:hypothetical protein
VLRAGGSTLRVPQVDGVIIAIARGMEQIPYIYSDIVRLGTGRHVFRVMSVGYICSSRFYFDFRACACHNASWCEWGTSRSC